MSDLSRSYPKLTILQGPRSDGLYPCSVEMAMSEAGISAPTPTQTMRMTSVLRALSRLYQGWDGARRPFFRRRLKMIDYAGSYGRLWFRDWPIDSVSVSVQGAEVEIDAERRTVSGLSPGGLYEASFYGGFLSPELVREWQPLTEYQTEDVIETERSFLTVIEPGTSGDQEPEWPTVDGGTITDGSILWQSFAGSLVPEDVQLVAAVRAAELLDQGFQLAPPNVLRVSDMGASVQFSDTSYTLTAIERGILAELR